MWIFFAKNIEVSLKYDKKEILKNQFIDCSNGAVGSLTVSVSFYKRIKKKTRITRELLLFW